MSGAGNGHQEATGRRVLSFAARRFGADAVVEHLAGDASDRSFFRLRVPGLGSVVAMVHAEPFRLEDLPWFQHARFLGSLGADVPALVSSWPGEGILLVQDLGDDTLMEVLGSATAERRHFLYRQAVQIIASLQKDGTPALPEDLPASRTALDTDRLLFELRFFMEHYAGSLLGRTLRHAESALLEDWFVDLATEVASYPFVLCHRDFHSRNLMLRGNRLYMIDFQDARMGPWLYDLASLLRDSYVELPEELVEEMLDFFLEALGSETGPSRAGLPAEELHRQFEMTSLQRNIKAVGTFAFQATSRGKDFYLRYIPHTLELVRANLARRGLDSILPLFQGPLLYRP